MEQEPAHRRKHLLGVGLFAGEVLAHGIEVYADNDEALIAVRQKQLAEVGKRHHAGRSPAGPEVDQDHLALVVGKTHGFAVDVGSFDRRGRLSHHLEPGESLGEMILNDLSG